jgi:hypothetical protein
VEHGHGDLLSAANQVAWLIVNVDGQSTVAFGRTVRGTSDAAFHFFSTGPVSFEKLPFHSKEELSTALAATNCIY